MSLHIHKPTNRLKKAENNIINTKISKPKHEFNNNPKKKYVVKEYANIRTDKRLVCKIRALNNVLGDKNIAITINRLLKYTLPKFINSKNKGFFETTYKILMNKIK